MRPLRLLNLLVNNAKRGEFRADAGSNTLFLYDVIVGSDAEAEFWGGVSPEAFIRQLSAMSGTVHLRINSPGGEVFAARAMAQAMREYAGDIVVHVDGLAASAATFLAVSGAKTIMAPGSFMMVHRASTLAWGNSEDLAGVAALLDKIDGTIAATYAAKAGKPADEFAAMMAAETWMTAEEAVAQRLADEVASDEAKVSNRWDLSAYDRAPQIDVAAEAVQASAEAAIEPQAARAELAAAAAAEAVEDHDQQRRIYAARELISRAA